MCEFASRGKVLSTLITKNGFTSHALNRTNLAKSKTQHVTFIEKSPKNKRTLYKALKKHIRLSSINSQYNVNDTSCQVATSSE